MFNTVESKKSQMKKKKPLFFPDLGENLDKKTMKACGKKEDN